MQTLSNDIIIEITDYLDLKSLLIYNTLNKDIFNLLDNNFYQNLAYKMYTKEFWDNMKFLLKKSVKINIYKKHDYKNNPIPYCGTEITDSPLPFNE